MRHPPFVPLPPLIQLLRYRRRQIEFMFRARRELGDVFAMRNHEPAGLVVTGHPGDARSLLAAKPELAESTAGEGPVLPIIGPDSVLTAVGERHMRQRKLLLPHFHGEAIDRYVEAIADATEREIDSWPLNRGMALAPRMQAITLDVIMAGIFGIRGRPRRGTAEHRLRTTVGRLTDFTTKPLGQLIELLNARNAEPVGLSRPLIGLLERAVYGVIEERRRSEDLDERRDILSMLLQARTEESETLSSWELRSELLTLVPRRTRDHRQHPRMGLGATGPLSTGA